MHTTRTQAAFRSIHALLTWSLLLFTLLLAMPAISQAAAPVIFYSDLDSGPNVGGDNNKGVYVTISGKNFGASPGTSSVTIGGGRADNYPLWSDTKIIFQLGANAVPGNITVTTPNGTSNGIPFTVRPGTIYFVSPNGTGNGLSATAPMSPSAAYAVMGPGNTFYFRAGTYTQNYGDGGAYSGRNYALGVSKGGTAGNPLALVGYPNEVAEFHSPASDRTNIIFVDNAGVPANYVTVSGLTLIGGSGCIEGGGWYATANSGGSYIRIIGNTLSATYGTANTMTGLITVENDFWRLYGNEFKNTGAEPAINNNHGIYVHAAGSNNDIGWNYFHDLIMGGVVQIHDDIYFVMSNNNVHDNVFAKGLTGDSRAIVVGGALQGTYGAIYNNIFDSIGQNYGAIGLNSGDWKVYNNTFYNIYSTSGIIWVNNLPRQLGGAPSNWAMPTADIKNNIIYSDGQSPYVTTLSGATWAQITGLSNNLYYNFGAAPSQDASAVTGDPLFINTAAGNFRLQPTSPAINRGTSAVNTIVSQDLDGAMRPQGGGFDIGAYEFAGAWLPAPQNLKIVRQ